MSIATAIDMQKIKELHIYKDGASRGNPGKAVTGIVICDATGIVTQKSFYLGSATNNAAESVALLLGLKEAKKLGGTVLFLYSDSELLVKQFKEAYRVKDEKLKLLFLEVKKRLSSFLRYKINHISRDNNKATDRLANEAFDQEPPAMNRAVFLLKS